MPGPKSDKIWAAAIRKAVLDVERDQHGDPLKGGDGKSIKRINTLAANLVKKANGGDVQAMKEVGDRLDGKPAQTIAGDVEAPLTVVIATGIVRADD